MTTRSIGPFLGPYRSLDYRYIPENAASQTLNTRHMDGALLPRYGYRAVANAQSGHTANYGAVYLQGYDSSYALVKEYITFENLGVSTRAYYRDTANGTPTQISATTRASSPWTGFSFDQWGYLINPDESTPVFRRTIGSAASFVAVQKPTAPTSALTYEILYQASSGQPYTQQTFTGTTVGSHITFTGKASATGAAVNTDGSLTIGHSAGAGQGSFEVDMKAGVGAGVTNLDWQYNDCFAFTLRAGNSTFEIDPSSLEFLVTNDDGSPVTFTPASITAVNSSQDPQVVVVRVQFDNKTRSSWDNIRKIKVSYNIITSSSLTANNTLTLSKIYVGCCYLALPFERLPSQQFQLAYTYYYSGATEESGLSPTLSIFNGVLRGTFPFSGLPGTATMDGLGVWLKVTFTASGDTNVDNYRLYWRDPYGDPKRIVEQSDATSTYTIKMAGSELPNLTGYTPTPFQFARCVNGFPFKGRVVWLYNQGQQNVRHSRIGEPEKQASETDRIDDDNRGATFSLADNFADFPFCGTELGDGCVIWGSNGAYTQLGDGGPACTPPKKLAHSFGCANKFAFARWATDSGQVGAAYATRNGEGIYMVIFHDGAGAENAFESIELTRDVRGIIKDFLIDGQALSLSTYQSNVRLGVDHDTNSLWVILNKRALVFRKSANETRYWEMYEYDTNSTNFLYPAFSARDRLRVLMSDGVFAELEYNSNSGAYITGTNRDAGRAMPSPFWESKTFAGRNRRVTQIGIERYDMTETPSVAIYSQTTPAGNSYTVAANKTYLRGWVTDQGEWNRFRITFGENTDAIQRLIVVESPTGKRLHR